MISSKRIKLKDFDKLFVGHPSDIEKNFKSLLPQAKSLKNKSIYLQILSQIALAQAMQKKFSLAHKTIDKAEKLLSPNYTIARARLLLERGRVFQQACNFKTALRFYFKSYEFSKKHKLTEQISSAAHMIAFTTNDVNDKIKWNKKVIVISRKSKSQKVRDWAMIEYNNLGSNYIQAKKYKNAMTAYKRCLQLATQKGLEVIALGAKWGIARSLRSLNAIDKALVIQLELLEKYNALYKKGILPIELFRVTRGLVYEELTEIYLSKMKQYASFAYADLSRDAWMRRLEAKRLTKLKYLRLGNAG